MGGKVVPSDSTEDTSLIVWIGSGSAGKASTSSGPNV